MEALQSSNWSVPDRTWQRPSIQFGDSGANTGVLHGLRHRAKVGVANPRNQDVGNVHSLNKSQPGQNINSFCYFHKYICYSF
jgi:hypothetical protein